MVTQVFNYQSSITSNINRKPHSNLQAINGYGKVEGFSLLGRVVWTHEMKAGEKFSIPDAITQIKVCYNTVPDAEPLSFLSDDIKQNIRDKFHIVRVNEEDKEKEIWEKVRPDASSDDDHVPDECLDGNHLGTRLRSMRILSDGTRFGACSHCYKSRYNMHKVKKIVHTVSYDIVI